MFPIFKKKNVSIASYSNTVIATIGHVRLSVTHWYCHNSAS